MSIGGRVQNGVVIPDGGYPLPEGAIVSISIVGPSPMPATKGPPISLPLVRSANPGSVKLTNERIGEILEEEDVPPRH